MWRYIDMFSSRPQLAETWSIMMLPIGLPPQRVVAVADPGVAAAEPHVADDDVVRFEFDRVAGDADAVAGALPPSMVMYGARTRIGSCSLMMPGDVEHDDPRPARFERFAETARAAVVEVRDDEHLAAAPAEAIHAAPLGAGERGNVGLRKIVRLGGAGDIRLALLGPRLDLRLRFGPCLVALAVHFAEPPFALLGDIGGDLGVLGERRYTGSGDGECENEISGSHKQLSVNVWVAVMNTLAATR